MCMLTLSDIQFILIINYLFIVHHLKETTSNYYICQNIVVSSWQREVRVKAFFYVLDQRGSD